MDDAPAVFRAKQSGFLPDILGLDWIELRHGFARGRFDVGKQHLAPNGYLHAATVVALADTACGYGCMVSLPEGAAGFTTIELKTNATRGWGADRGITTLSAQIVEPSRGRAYWIAGCSTRAWVASPFQS